MVILWKPRWYGTKSIPTVSWTSISPDSTASTRSEVLIGALAELYSGEEFDLRLLLNLCNGSETSIRRSFHVLPPLYDLLLADSLSVSVNYSPRILCPCRSSKESTFHVRATSEESQFAAQQCFNVWGIESCAFSTNITLRYSSS